MKQPDRCGRTETMHVGGELFVVLNSLAMQQQRWGISVKYVVPKSTGGAQGMSFLDGHGVLVAYPMVHLAPFCFWFSCAPVTQSGPEVQRTVERATST